MLDPRGRVVVASATRWRARRCWRAADAPASLRGGELTPDGRARARRPALPARRAPDGAPRATGRWPSRPSRWRRVDRSVHRVLVLLLIAGPAALLATALGGWWLARRALRPIERMTARAAAIDLERLEDRLVVPRTGDEVAHLATHAERDARPHRARRRGAAPARRRRLARAAHAAGGHALGDRRQPARRRPAAGRAPGARERARGGRSDERGPSTTCSSWPASTRAGSSCWWSRSICTTSCAPRRRGAASRWRARAASRSSVDGRARDGGRGRRPPRRTRCATWSRTRSSSAPRAARSWSPRGPRRARSASRSATRGRVSRSICASGSSTASSAPIRSRTRSTGGGGLGLAISREIARGPRRARLGRRRRRAGQRLLARARRALRAGGSVRTSPVAWRWCSV